MQPPTNDNEPLPAAWEAWCKRGRPSAGHRRRAVRQLLKNGEVRGYYSDLLLDPTLPDTHPLYPSVEHTSYPKQPAEIVVETRIVNDMKSILSEKEFWHVIEHLFVVGTAQKKIMEPCQRRDAWSPARHYAKKG